MSDFSRSVALSQAVIQERSFNKIHSKISKRSIDWETSNQVTFNTQQFVVFDATNTFISALKSIEAQYEVLKSEKY